VRDGGEDDESAEGGLELGVDRNRFFFGQTRQASLSHVSNSMVMGGIRRISPLQVLINGL